MSELSSHVSELNGKVDRVAINPGVDASAEHVCDTAAQRESDPGVVLYPVPIATAAISIPTASVHRCGRHRAALISSKNVLQFCRCDARVVFAISISAPSRPKRRNPIVIIPPSGTVLDSVLVEIADHDAGEIENSSKLSRAPSPGSSGHRSLWSLLFRSAASTDRVVPYGDRTPETRASVLRSQAARSQSKFSTTPSRSDFNG